MKSLLEQELKLRPGPDFRPLELPGKEIAEQTLISTYFDTDDLRLAAAAVTLRRRETDGGSPVWQLKLPRGDDRRELEWEATGPVVPETIDRLLVAYTRRQPLGRIATLRTRRSGVLVREHGVDLAEVVEDAVDVVEDGRTLRSFEEIEVELVDGDRKALRKLEKSLRDAGAIDADGRPKLFQALELDRISEPGRERRRGPAGSLAAMLREQYDEILRNDPGTRLGDPEALHDHRVAVRRLRAVLRAGRPLLDRGWADGLRDALRPAGQALAEVRDLDVHLDHVQLAADNLPDLERAGATDIRARLGARRDAAQQRLVATLSEPWYVSLLNRVEMAVNAPRLEGDGSLAEAAQKEHRRARKLVRGLSQNPEPSDADLHEVRKAVKRARYAAELAGAAGVPG